ncbi:hypothetical protein GBA52_010724 [Prunus armeniaca]|nr:hypothetical protein GBA52_010724 [Prunus armeniaca]
MHNQSKDSTSISTFLTKFTLFMNLSRQLPALSGTLSFSDFDIASCIRFNLTLRIRSLISMNPFGKPMISHENPTRSFLHGHRTPREHSTHNQRTKNQGKGSAQLAILSRKNEIAKTVRKKVTSFTCGAGAGNVLDFYAYGLSISIATTMNNHHHHPSQPPYHRSPLPSLFLNTPIPHIARQT